MGGRSEDGIVHGVGVHGTVADDDEHDVRVGSVEFGEGTESRVQRVVDEGAEGATKCELPPGRDCEHTTWCRIFRLLAVALIVENVLGRSNPSTAVGPRL
jgi:hypothetical protein